MTPDRDPDTTQAVPRHTGTGHVPAVDPALAELRRRFAEGMSKPPVILPAGPRPPVWQRLAGWLCVLLLAALLAAAARLDMLLYHPGGGWP